MTLLLTYKGFDYVAFFNGAYEDNNSLSSLVQTGANSIEATLDYGIDVNTSQVVADPNYTDSLAALGNTIKQAEQLGLTVMVRPLIDFLDPSEIGGYSVGEWRQDYQPTNVAAFFASYQQMIVAEAKVAQANGAQLLSIGAELDQLAGPQYLSYWTSIIDAVRAVFSGKLTYSASWQTAANVSFWSQLDYEGIDSYVPLSNAQNPTLQDLIDGWTQPATQSSNPVAYSIIGNQSPIEYFENLSAQSGKPLLFTELGYANDSGAAADPAAEGNNPDPALQAELYQAFFDAWQQAGNSSLVGAYFWEWDPNSANGGPDIDSFSPQNNPAQATAAAGFASTSRVSTPSGTSATMFMSDGSGDLDIYDLGSSAILASYPLLETSSKWQLAALGGFNGTDTDDVLLHNGSTGAFELYDVNNSGVTASVSMGQVGLEWTIAGFSDFSGNAGETDMLMRSATGAFELYDIRNNQITGYHAMGQVGLDWQVVGFGDFSGNADETDMLMRGATGAFELYDIGNNQITGYSAMGQVGLDWQVVDFGDFSGNAGETDMLMRSATGAFELYDIRNNQITGYHAMGQVGLDWQVVGFGDFSGNAGETDMLMRSATGAFELYDISNNQITDYHAMGQVGLEWTIVGFSDFSGNAGETDMLMRSATGAFELYDISNNQITGFYAMGQVGTAWQVAGIPADQPTGASNAQFVQALASLSSNSSSSSGQTTADAYSQPAQLNELIATPGST